MRGGLFLAREQGSGESLNVGGLTEDGDATEGSAVGVIRGLGVEGRWAQ